LGCVGEGYVHDLNEFDVPSRERHRDSLSENILFG